MAETSDIKVGDRVRHRRDKDLVVERIEHRRLYSWVTLAWDGEPFSPRFRTYLSELEKVEDADAQS